MGAGKEEGGGEAGDKFLSNVPTSNFLPPCADEIKNEIKNKYKIRCCLCCSVFACFSLTALKVKLMMRRPYTQLVDQGIMPRK